MRIVARSCGNFILFAFKLPLNLSVRSRRSPVQIPRPGQPFIVVADRASIAVVAYTCMYIYMYIWILSNRLAHNLGKEHRYRECTWTRIEYCVGWYNQTEKSRDWCEISIGWLVLTKADWNNHRWMSFLTISSSDKGKRSCLPSTEARDRRLHQMSRLLRTAQHSPLSWQHYSLMLWILMTLSKRTMLAKTEEVKRYLDK